MRRSYSDFQRRRETASDVKRLCIYAGIILLAAVAENSFFASLRYLPAPPDLIMGVICVIALTDKKENAVIAALIGGVVTDALGGAGIYLSVPVYFALAVTLTAFSGKMLKRYPSYLALLGIALIFRAVFTFGVCVLVGKTDIASALLSGVLPRVISTAVFCLPLYFAVRPAARAFSMDRRKGMYE